MANTQDIVTKYYYDRFKHLLNGVVTSIVVDDSADHGMPYCGFYITCKNGDIYEVIAEADAEGNGPGHMTLTKVEKRVF